MTTQYYIQEYAKTGNIEQLEATLLQKEQNSCPVIHTFGPGVYVRELRIPAGTFAIGHKQKYDHLNLFLRGRMIVPDGEGGWKEMCAPIMFTGKLGRKIGYALEDTVWLNIFPTDKTDVAELEREFFDKSEEWGKMQKQKRLECEHFPQMLEDLGVTAETIKEQSENEDDLIGMPYGSYKFATGDSEIHEKGIFATADIQAYEVIGPAKIKDKRTLIGRYLNHSDTLNAVLKKVGDTVYLIAAKDLQGCKGGMIGEEITTDYRQNIEILRGEKCQE